MQKRQLFMIAAVAAAAVAWSVGAQTARPDPKMSFFITGVGLGDGGNLGGLAGADKHCTALAAKVGASKKAWRAYLSADPGTNARDRIGTGPWYNFKGELIARNVTELHSDPSSPNKDVSLTETGLVVNGRGDMPNKHDMLTGSDMDGSVAKGTTNLTCANWTSNGAGSAQVGHHDRRGTGPNTTSWNSAHASRACSQADLVATGGSGLFYCFATD